MQYLKQEDQSFSLLLNRKQWCVILIDHGHQVWMIPDVLLIYMHFVLKHYYNYYTKQVHFQWKWYITYWVQVSLCKCFQIYCHNSGKQSWSHWEKCKHHHQLLLPQCHSQKILPKLKLVSVLICQDIFVLTCLSCCNNSFPTFVQ